MVNALKNASPRLVSIDALRAVVMVLMIFVNDLWTLIGIPVWLEHTSGKANYMGLADIVFPAFLFIVGLSVPYAIDSRRKKGESDAKIFMHIVFRTLALLIMGFFQVNLESYAGDAILPKPIWQILITIGFFLVWLDYSNYKVVTAKVLKGAGIVLLLVLALLYKGNDGTGITAMEIQWWGILGLIGWAYFISSCVFLFSGGNLLIQILALVFFVVFNSASAMGWLSWLDPVREYIWISGDGSMPALPMAGIVTALFYRKYDTNGRAFWISILGFAAVLFLYGYLTSPVWGISKIRATPSWTTICSAITIAGLALMVYLTEIVNKRKWYDYIKPAGTSTLTCYLLPYFHYALIGLLSLPQLPEVLRTGSLGLLKSLVYALIIVALAGLLQKRNIRLKI